MQNTIEVNPLDQMDIFDFINDLPEIGKQYGMLLPAEIGFNGATATVKKVDPQTQKIYCDIKSNKNGLGSWHYSTVFSLGAFNEAVERSRDLVRKAQESWGKQGRLIQK